MLFGAWSDHMSKATQLGVPMHTHWLEVVALAHAHPSFKHAVHEGIDSEDLMQHIAQSLIVRNQGKSPWDPNRCSLGTYIWLVTRSVVSNQRRKHRRQQLEQVGIHEDVQLWMVPVPEDWP